MQSHLETGQSDLETGQESHLETGQSDLETGQAVRLGDRPIRLRDWPGSHTGRQANQT